MFDHLFKTSFGDLQQVDKLDPAARKAYDRAYYWKTVLEQQNTQLLKKKLDEQQKRLILEKEYEENMHDELYGRYVLLLNELKRIDDEDGGCDDEEEERLEKLIQRDRLERHFVDFEQHANRNFQKFRERLERRQIERERLHDRQQEQKRTEIGRAHV